MNLERQLADYGKHLRQVIARLEVPVKAGVAVRPVQPAAAPVGGRFDMGKTATWLTGRRGLLIATAALVAALVIALPLWFVFRGEESPPVVAEPTTTVPTTTTSAKHVPEVDHIWAWSPGFVAVSAEEAWAFDTGIDWAGVAHFRDGTWAWAWFTFDTDLPGFEAVGQARSGLAVAPDGTVWVSGPGGVFSFDGVEWTRRFDYGAGGVAVAPDGTVWIGADWWLARWDGGSWIPVGPNPQEPPDDITGYSIREARGCGPRSGVATSDGEVWMVGCAEGFLWLLHYDGTTLRDADVLQVSHFDWLDVEAAPNGGVWTLMNWFEDDRRPWLLGRFDGEVWTTYTPPFGDENTPGWGPAMASGPDGRVWFGTDDGLLAFDGTDWTYHLQGQRVTDVDVAPDGTVWYIDQDGAHILGS